MVEAASSILIYIAFIGFAAKRLLTYLHAFQQDDYHEGRFIGWVLGNFVVDKKMSVILAVAAAGALFTPPFLPALLVFAGFAVIGFSEKDPRKNSKKKLAMTSRASRIYTAALCICAFMGLWVFIAPQSSHILWLVPVHAIPYMLIAGNILLSPFESSVQNKFWKEAQEKLNRFRPTVIGVTGSYGKTSVKHILGHVLKAAAPTLVTPGSVNTPMGIARIVREELDSNHKFFVVEMGAYGPGSIARLCKLTSPDLGIITVIGHAHYERFRSLETVAQAKYELAHAVIDNSGTMIVHEKTLGFAATDAIRQKKPNSFITVGENKNNNLQITEVTQTNEGLDVVVEYKGEDFLLTAPLFGLHHAQNMAFVFAAARALDIPAQTIITAMKSTPQIPHRLEVKKQPGGGAIIDDAFNSNPLGFRSALDLMARIAPGKRKILITPGMVELGAMHDDVHEKIGHYAGEVCDVLLAVNAKRIPTFIKGFKEKGNGKKVEEFKTFADAQKWVNDNKQPGDVILIENDLPDLYEQIPRI